MSTPKQVSIRLVASSQTTALRHSVLWPTKDASFVLLAEDDLPSTLHLGLFTSTGAPRSVLTLVPECFPSPELVHLQALRFRKFATAVEDQGRGLGSQLLTAVWSLAQERAVELIWCDARTEQEGWYARRGMERVGVEFVKDGRGYVRMAKRIVQN